MKSVGLQSGTSKKESLIATTDVTTSRAPTANQARSQQRRPLQDYDLNSAQSFWGAVLGSLMGLALSAAGLAIGVGITGLAGDTKSFWYLSRSAGFVAYLLLWGSVVWGMLLSSRLGWEWLRPPVLLDAHQFLSNVGLGFTFFHSLILMGDHYLGFPLRAVLVPFAGDYKPALVAAGQLALWLSLLLILSFYLRRRLGQKLWRWFHYSSFVAYWAALLHALAIGSDTDLLGIQVLYLVTAGGVLFLTYYRALSPRNRHRLAPAKPSS